MSGALQPEALACASTLHRCRACAVGQVTVPCARWGFAADPQAALHFFAFVLARSGGICKGDTGGTVRFVLPDHASRGTERSKFSRNARAIKKGSNA
jgi:hypothetical protein